MMFLAILATLSVLVSAYAVVHALRHDPRRPDLTPPRSHLHEVPSARSRYLDAA